MTYLKTWVGSVKFFPCQLCISFQSSQLQTDSGNNCSVSSYWFKNTAVKCLGNYCPIYMSLKWRTIKFVMHLKFLWTKERVHWNVLIELRWTSANLPNLIISIQSLTRMQNANIKKNRKTVVIIKKHHNSRSCKFVTALTLLLQKYCIMMTVDVRANI